MSYSSKIVEVRTDLLDKKKITCFCNDDTSETRGSHQILDLMKPYISHKKNILNPLERVHVI